MASALVFLVALAAASVSGLHLGPAPPAGPTIDPSHPTAHDGGLDGWAPARGAGSPDVADAIHPADAPWEGIANALAAATRKAAISPAAGGPSSEVGFGSLTPAGAAAASARSAATFVPWVPIHTSHPLAARYLANPLGNTPWTLWVSGLATPTNKVVSPTSFLADAEGWNSQTSFPFIVKSAAASPATVPWAPTSAASPINPGLQAAATQSYLADAAGWPVIPSQVNDDAVSPAARAAAGAASWSHLPASSPINPGHQAAATPSYLADVASWAVIPSQVIDDAISPAARVATAGAAPWAHLPAASPINPGHQAAATPSHLADAAGWAVIPSQVKDDAFSPAARIAAAGAAPWAHLPAASPINPGHQAAATPSYLADAAGWAVIPSQVIYDAVSPAARVAAAGAAPWAHLPAASLINPGHQAAATQSYLADAAGWPIIPSQVNDDAVSPAARASAGAASWSHLPASSPINPGHQAAATQSYLADAAGWPIIPSQVNDDAVSPVARAAAGAASWSHLPASSPINPGHQAAATPSYLADVASWAVIPSQVKDDAVSPAARVATAGAAPWAHLPAASLINPGHQAAATPSYLADSAGWAVIPSQVKDDAVSPAARVAAAGAAPWAHLPAASLINPGHKAAATPSYLADAAGWAVIPSQVKDDNVSPAARIAAARAAPWAHLPAGSPINPGHQAAASQSYLADAGDWAMIPSQFNDDAVSPAARAAASGVAF